MYQQLLDRFLILPKYAVVGVAPMHLLVKVVFIVGAQTSPSSSVILRPNKMSPNRD